MECIAVKVSNIGCIKCQDITRSEGLPGFFYIWLSPYERRIINGSQILEIYENKIY